MSNETVGSLLAVIANSLNDGLRIMMFADKRAWGSDEFEQLRLLEETLDEAKKDFQEMPALVNGRFYYEHDRIGESLEDLRALCTRFELHARSFKDWVRSGCGPIDPTWAQETLTLKQDLHRAQCRAARRIFGAQRVDRTDGGARCLGALQVYRIQQQRKKRYVPVEEERRACAQTGKFQRLGEADVAFVCDFCDGFLVWEDLRAVPTTRLQQQSPTQGNGSAGGSGNEEPASAVSTTSTTGLAPDGSVQSSGGNDATGASTNALKNTTTTESDGTYSIDWQARGITMTTSEAKVVVFAPDAIANHLPPEIGEWRSRILCSLCDDYFYEEQGDDDMDRVRYMQDDRGFEDIKTFQEHLEWTHGSMVPSTSSCEIM